MPEHDLIAILDTPCLPSVSGDLQTSAAAGMTAVYARGRKPLLSLPQSRKDVLMRAAERQAQLEDLMRLGTVVPVDPKTTVNPHHLPASLTANGPLLRDLFSWLYGTVQYQITVTWHPRAALSHFRNSDELRPLFATGTVDATALQQGVEALLGRLRGQMRLFLDDVVTDVIALPTTPEKILNVVVLLPTVRQDALDAAVRKIDALWSEGLKIRQIGPAPASSFALLSATPVEPAMLTRARSVLGLTSRDADPDWDRLRHNALMRPEADAHEIRRALTLLQAHGRLGTQAGPFHLFDVSSQGQSTSVSAQMAVA